MSIVLQQLAKLYDGHPVVQNLSLEVADGELFVLLGPSGSGKSTVLRMIAGLADIDEGRVLLHGRDVTHVPPQRRGVGFVFQHYALFRHMSAADNIEFALRIRRIAAGERRRRRDELLELVGLAGLGARMPAQLSGGQQQRVALARALAHRPEVLLLDEPFGALDAKIRADLRRTIRGIQRELGVTTIFVTHDQEEAFELADRLGIMNFGRLLEVGPPAEIYLHPETEFAATFLGAANLMVGECAADGVRLGPVHFPLGTQLEAMSGARRVQVLFRPEDVAVKDAPEALSWPLLGKATVEESAFTGSIEKLRLRLPPLAGVRPISPPSPFGGDFILVEAIRSQHQARRHPLRPGDEAWIGVRRVHALTHPGLSLLLVTDGSPESESALRLGGEMARLAHARVTILAHGLGGPGGLRHLQLVKETMGAGLASIQTRVSLQSQVEAVASQTARDHYDLVIAGLPPRERVAFAERLLLPGDWHLLLVPAPGPIPANVLVCVAAGEPAKANVLFTGRLVRHLRAGATLLAVLPEGRNEQAVRQAERFLAASARTLSLLDVPARAALRTGGVLDEIGREIQTGDHQMVVVGSPLPSAGGRVSLNGVTGALMGVTGERPILITRFRLAGPGSWARGE
ncbi:MAG TPA: ATP-binding cassette domain-containing protein [Candidatus Polarisedimenticolia bacterium]|jgi:sulfate transport system ATP-binding protein